MFQGGKTNLSLNIPFHSIPLHIRDLSSWRDTCRLGDALACVILVRICYRFPYGNQIRLLCIHIMLRRIYLGTHEGRYYTNELGPNHCQAEPEYDDIRQHSRNITHGQDFPPPYIHTLNMHVPARSPPLRQSLSVYPRPRKRKEFPKDGPSAHTHTHRHTRACYTPNPNPTSPPQTQLILLPLFLGSTSSTSFFPLFLALTTQHTYFDVCHESINSNDPIRHKTKSRPLAHSLHGDRPFVSHTSLVRDAA